MKRELLDKNNILRCPVCGLPLGLDESGRSFVCTNETKKHLFDIASSGYVNLLGGAKSGDTRGDSKEMVRARSAFLEKDYYAPFADAIVSAAKKYGAKIIADAGCGEGYYTGKLAGIPGVSVYGFDISKHAVEHAAKSAKRNALADNTFYSVSSVFELPIADGGVDTVVNLFAPCAKEEFERVSADGGYLICGTAGREHLIELKRALYDEVYENEARADIPDNYTYVETVNVKYTFCVDNNADLQNLFAMTPYYFRTSERDREKLLHIDSLDITADFDILIFKKGK